MFSKQILSKTPTELRYIERSMVMKDVNNQNLWNFELARQEKLNVRIWIVIGYKQRDRQDMQNLNIDTFRRLPDFSCQCINGSEKHPDCGILVKYDDDD